MNLIILSGRIQILKIIGNSTAELFKHLERGDILNLQVILQQGANDNGINHKLYAVNVEVNLFRTHEYRCLSINNFNKIMEKFIYKQLVGESYGQKEGD